MFPDEFRRVERTATECVEMLASDESIPHEEALKQAIQLGFLIGLSSYFNNPSSTFTKDGWGCVLTNDELTGVLSFLDEELLAIIKRNAEREGVDV